MTDWFYLYIVCYFVGQQSGETQQVQAGGTQQAGIVVRWKVLPPQSKVISIHSILMYSYIFNANYVTYPSCNGGTPEYRPAVNLIYSSHSQRHT